MRQGFRRVTAAAALVFAVVLAGEARAACPGGTTVVSSDITTDTTWSANNEYCLSGVRFVRNGATLQIEPGTVVRGDVDSKKCFLNGTACNVTADCNVIPGDVCVNDPGALVVARGSKLFAQGTRLKPIVFTNLDDDNLFANSEPSPGGDYADKLNALGHEGEWGGVILLGRGYVANNSLTGPNPAREIQVEGLQSRGVCANGVTRCIVNADCGAATPCNTTLGFYGNCSASPLSVSQCDDDDSGTMDYVSIRYGGFNLAANNEINGLTLGGVGRATDISNIEVFQNQDDGVEMFGGAVNMKNVAIVSPGDDSIDYDEGWRGKVQFAFILQGAAGNEKSDKGGEHDGGNSPDGSQPRAIPTLYNVTSIGLGGNGAVALPDLNDPANAYTGRAMNSNLLFRDNAGGRYYNSAFLNYGGTTVMIEGASPASANTSAQRTGTDYVPGTGNCSVTTSQACGVALPACPGGETCVLHYREADSAAELDLRDNLFWCFGNGSTIPLTGADAVAAGANDNVAHYDPGVFTNAALNNTYQNCAAALPIRQLVRGLGIAGSPDPIDAIDPRPSAGSPLLTTSRVPPADGFFQPAPYKGAFGDANWLEGWSNLAHLGYFPAKPVVNVTSDITANTTWTNQNEYQISGVRFVRSGATLTIQPGTIVRGQPDSKKCFLSGAVCNVTADCNAIPGDICVNDPGAIVVTRGSKIQAVGTADQPIVFTNVDDDNVRDSLGIASGDYNDKLNALGHEGEWGGVILLGRGYVANNSLTGPNPAREIQVEGLQSRGVCANGVTRCIVNADCGAATPCNTTLGFYGNCSASPLSVSQCDDDDSGTMDYVSIRYGGFNLAANNEINGLTLGGVGRATDISNIEVFQNQDDGVEMFGGAVNMKNVAIVSPGDDSIDYDEGWRGKVQFAFILQGAAGNEKSDKGGEHDGGNSPDGSQPRAIPTLYNVTSIGLGGNGAVALPDLNDPANAYTGRAMNSNLLFRDNAGGRYYNSAFLNYGGTTVMIEGASPASANTSAQRTGTDYVPGTGNCSVTTSQACGVALPACPGGETCVLHYREADSAAELDLRDNLFWCFGNGSTIPLTGADAVAAGANDNVAHYDPGVFTNAALNNTYQNCAAALPIRQLVRGSGIAGLPDPIDSLDPRPAASSSLLTTTRNAPADGFFQPARYKGAFGSTNWLDGWSNLSRLGYFPTCSGTTTGATPGEPQNLRFATPGDKAQLGWAPVPAPGLMGNLLYDVLRTRGTTSSAAADFGLATCLESNGGDTVAADSELPNGGEVFFYLVRAGNACGEGSLGYQSNGTPRNNSLSCP